MHIHEIEEYQGTVARAKLPLSLLAVTLVLNKFALLE